MKDIFRKLRGLEIKKCIVILETFLISKEILKDEILPTYKL